MKENKYGRKFCKIALTGAAGSGKTTALESIPDIIAERYKGKWQVLTVTESASLFFETGLQRSEMSDEQIRKFQEDLLRTIIQLENVYTHIAEKEDKCDTLILCDRGAIDPKVYTKEKDWPEIIRKVGRTEEELLDSYAGVIQIYTAPRKFYNQRQNACRRESHEESEQINQRYEEVWKGHKRFVQIKNRDNPPEQTATEAWNEKLADILQVIQTILDE